MRLSMDSYSLYEYYHTVLGKTRTKNLHVNRDNLNEVIHLINTFMPKNIFQIAFLKNLRESVKFFISHKKLIRDVKDVGPYVVDRYFELDSLGLEKYSKKYTAVATTWDCLDLVLNHICGANIEKVRNIDNYKQISRALITGDFDLMSKLSFQSLVNVDDRLDEYLVAYYSASEDKYEFLRTITQAISTEAQAILDNTMSRFRTYYEEYYGDTIVLRAMSGSRLIIGSEKPFEYELRLDDHYYLKVRTYEKFEYINHVQDTCCIYEGGVEDDPLRDI